MGYEGYIRSITLPAAAIAVAVGCGALYSGPVFRAALVTDLGRSNELAAGAFAVGYLAAGATPFVSGMVADRFGAPRLLVFGLLLAGLWAMVGGALTGPVGTASRKRPSEALDRAPRLHYPNSVRITY